MFLVQTLIWEYLVILKCSCDVLEVSLAGTLPDFCVRGIIWLLIHLCRDHNWRACGEHICYCSGKQSTHPPFYSPHSSSALAHFNPLADWVTTQLLVNCHPGRWLYFHVSLVYQMVLTIFSFTYPGPICHTYSVSKRPKWPSVQQRLLPSSLPKFFWNDIVFKLAWFKCFQCLCRNRK